LIIIIFFSSHQPKNGVISAVVYIALSISLTACGFLSDFVGRKHLIKNDTLSRKLFETIALVGPAICLSLIPQVRCDTNLVIALLVIALTIFGLNAGGDKPAVVDIAPGNSIETNSMLIYIAINIYSDHSGTIYGLTNAIASLPGIIAPLVVGIVIGDKVSVDLNEFNEKNK
jgi:ACS family sodium-dependent inorganic phosphate cotransporter-like MFS transporter 5